MESKARQEAAHFLENEKQFRLGVLPTEQSNPKTRHLDVTFAKDLSEGVRMLLSVDRDVHRMALRVLNGSAFKHMVDTGACTIREGRKIVFSGCGATGRLSILLESMWQCFFRDLRMEFAFEARRYADIIRWRRAEKVLNDKDYGLLDPDALREKVVRKNLWFMPGIPAIDEDGTADFSNLYGQGLIKLLSVRSFDKSKHYLWPVPTKELLINSNLNQNPGY